MFAFKKFVIHQDHCAMKVGTDGVLLGAWANGGSRILDIGTGTGLIALMMAQRFADATIDAVEIDAEAAAQARENVAATAYADRISIAETAIQLYPTHHKYDAIVSNPPFFIDSLINPNAQRTTARHACALKYCELFAAVKALLDSDGEFSAISYSLVAVTLVSYEYEVHPCRTAIGVETSQVVPVGTWVTTGY